MKNRYNKKLYAFSLTFSFLLLLATIGVLNITSKDKTFSENENRKLAKKPKFSIESILDGRYTKKTEKYVADQFIGRDGFIKIKANTDRLLGKKEENEVYIGDEGYLIEQFKVPLEENLNSNLEAINKFSDKYKGMKQYMVIVPNAVSILENKLPSNAPVVSQKLYLDKLKKTIGKNVEFVDVFNSLYEHKDEYIYYKTDHHWTTLGGYYTFLKLAENMKLEVKQNYYDLKIVENKFYGTLSSKVGIKNKEPDSINIYLPKNGADEVSVNYVEEKKKTTSLYNSKKLNTKDKYGVFLEGNHPLVKINTTANNNDRLLIVKDSYANSFVQFLTPYFSEIVLVDPRYYYEDLYKLISEEKITHTLFLYNANTFFQDNSLSAVLNNE